MLVQEMMHLVAVQKLSTAFLKMLNPTGMHIEGLAENNALLDYCPSQLRAHRGSLLRRCRA